LLMTSLCWHH